MAAPADGKDRTLWRPGQVILDLYEVRDVLPGGGMGLVYRVRHRGWNMDLAVKTPRPERAASPSGLRNFEVEAESWVNLGLHPHAVSCAYVRRIDGIPRVFAEWVDGGSLADAVRGRQLYRDGPQQALRRILDLAIQIGWGLEHAHRSGLIHQDVKPANVMLTPDGTAKVTDFGLARARAAAGESSAPPLGGSLLASYGGRTPAYCSPEQAEAAAGRSVKLTRATDLWSWAVTVLEMFTGGPPTQHGQVADRVLDAFRSAAPPDRQIPRLPEELAELLATCLRPRPEERPGRISDLIDTLADIYVRVTGQPYPRAYPAAATLLADGLSNHALSMLDLGHRERAEELWDKAIQADPHHPHAVYNRGLYRWRTGRQSDAELIAELDGVRVSHPRDWVDEYLLGLVYLERGDSERAEQMLAKAAALAPSAPGVDTARATAGSIPRVRPPVDLRGQRSSIEAVALDPDGRYAVSGGFHNAQPPRPGSEGGTIRLWDAATGRCLHRLAGHQAAVTTLAVAADARLIAAGSRDGALLIWDGGTGMLRHRLTGHRGEVEALSFSADGNILVSASRDSAVLVWDTRTARQVRVLNDGQRETGSGGQVAVGEHLVVRWEPMTLRLRGWDAATGDLVRSIQLIAASTVLSMDGRMALAVRDATLQLWEPATGKLLRAVELRQRPRNVLAVSGDGRLALLSGPDGLGLVELETGRCLRTYPVQRGPAVLTANGRLALSCAGGDLRVWEVAPAGPPSPWSHPRPRQAGELVREADIVSAALDRADRHARQGAWSAAADQVRAALQVPGYERRRELLDRWAEVGRHGHRSGLLNVVQVGELEPADSFTVSPDGSLAMCADYSDTVRVLEVDSGRQRYNLYRYGDWVTCLLFGADSRTAVIGAGDETVRVWDLTTGHLRHALKTRGSRPSAMGFTMPAVLSTDGRCVVAGTRGGKIVLWDIVKGRRLLAMPHHRMITGVAISPDDRIVASTDGSGEVWLWDLVAGRRRHILPGIAATLRTLAFSVDGSTALSPGHAGDSVWVCQPVTRHLRGFMMGHDGKVSAAAVSADGRLAHTASADGALRVWDVDRKHCLRVLTGHRGPVVALSPTADGRFTLSLGEDGTIRAWDLTTGQCLCVLDGHDQSVWSVSSDSRVVLARRTGGGIRVWRFDWDYEVPKPADWDERARPYLSAFAVGTRWRQRPRAEEEFPRLLRTLELAGLGWLRPDGVRAELARMPVPQPPGWWSARRDRRETG
ncbi:protein kinase [Micromonospora sp. NPDC005806]|uniref:protein kinase domain-containing protein n=1 Tax=Micromonospora sp. NPDC005806 TaxID=3364234 RepID=UPI0036B6F4BB